MALIRCPQCDTLHDVEGSFFAKGPRKVRCAECRTVWEATDPDAPQKRTIIPSLDLKINPPEVRAAAAKAEPEAVAAPALDQAAIDAMDFGLPAENPAEERAISPEELEALFAEEASPAPAAQKAADPLPEGAKEPPAGFNEPIRVPEEMAERLAPPAAEGGPEDGPDRRANRRNRRLAAAEAHHRHEAKAAGRTSLTGIVLAAGIGSLAMLGILRHETVRLFPQTAPLFAAIGLGVKQHQLDIDNVRSRLSRENGLETLEVTGTIANLSKSVQKIPVMRLSIRSTSGQEIYVWTATADQPELAPGESTTFRRRLASPPADSHSVMVRFVAKDDIVAAIR
ncbi:MAG: zinc-ribbon domain-containing protein [Beijerinckiaceae bacterium]|nr:zinc-ribbon domain-containing protein [Beijerinckiaceae bacterium]